MEGLSIVEDVKGQPCAVVASPGTCNAISKRDPALLATHQLMWTRLGA